MDILLYKVAFKFITVVAYTVNVRNIHWYALVFFVHMCLTSYLETFKWLY